MPDRLTPDQRRLNMSRVRSKNTKPEISIRKLLHGTGFRFRLHRRDLPGCPDIVLPRYRAVIFVHGCFWHGHECSLFKMPATRTDFWSAKIEANHQRDQAAMAGLRAAGWRCLLIWECALRGRGRLAHELLTDKVVSFVTGETKLVTIEEAAESYHERSNARDRA